MYLAINKGGIIMSELKIKCLSSLSKVMSDSEPFTKEYTEHSILVNEKSSFQIAYCANEDLELNVTFNSTLGNVVKAFTVRELSSCSPACKGQDDYVIRRETSNYPEVLYPYDKNDIIIAKANKWSSIWFDIDSDNDLPTGKHPITINFVAQGNVIAVATYTVEVINATLPKQNLIYTNWFHSDCLMNHYGIEAFSDEYWIAVKNYLTTAVKYGMNMVLTPLFTPPLDTKIYGERPTVQLVDVKINNGKYSFGFDNLEKWIRLCQDIGIEYFEMSHFYTQWGAKHAPKIIADVNGKSKKIFGWSTFASGKKYRSFIESFATELKQFIIQQRISDKCYFHVSDEPNASVLLPYKRASAIVNSNFSEFPIIDALSDYNFYKKKLIQTPIPANNHIDAFIGNVPELWTYYCSAQHDKYVSNRFFNMPSQRNRILGYQLFKYDVKGFLHWGYNYWYTRLSKSVIDPYEVTDAGGAFSAGDSCVVYPSNDYQPLVSLRLKVFYDALQDMRALQLLANLIGKEKALEIIENEGKITFSEYPHSDDWQISSRQAVNRAIENALK